MRTLTTFLTCLLFLVVVLTSASAATQSPDLEVVLGKMESVGAKVRSMSCDIVQQRWTELLKRFDQPETGVFAFSREESGLALRRDIKEPGQHTLLIRDGKLLFFQPKIKQAHEHNLGSNRDKAEFLLLGFSGDAIKEAYETRLLGEDAVGGRPAYKLELKPRSGQVAALFPRIVLWIDAEWWIPIQQQLFEPTRDYQLIRFDNVELNPTLKSSRFEVKLPKDVNVIKS